MKKDDIKLKQPEMENSPFDILMRERSNRGPQGQSILWFFSYFVPSHYQTELMKRAEKPLYRRKIKPKKCYQNATILMKNNEN